MGPASVPWERILGARAWLIPDSTPCTFIQCQLCSVSVAVLSHSCECDCVGVLGVPPVSPRTWGGFGDTALWCSVYSAHGLPSSPDADPGLQ